MPSKSISIFVNVIKISFLVINMNGLRNRKQAILNMLIFTFGMKARKIQKAEEMLSLTIGCRYFTVRHGHGVRSDRHTTCINLQSNSLT